MLTNNPFSKRHFWCLPMIFFFLCTSLSAQISGIVTSDDGEALIGATIVVKESSVGTTTDVDGKFLLPDVAVGSILVISYTGFTEQEIPASTDMKIIMTSGTMMDEIVVTGVFDARTRMEASVAISTLNAKDIQLQAPGSGAELLKNMPGVYVNSVSGEFRNIVYSRGIAAGSSQPSSGYFYVSLQEDGLPVTNLFYRNLVPDQFFRPDITLERVEGIRGGSASITSANAPGGIFNYISKTGGEEFGGTFGVRLGLEGNGQFPYYRGEFNVGGPIGKDKSLRYNIGGFYRYSFGPHSPGYAQNHGGQIKANLTKVYGKGSLKLYGKYLHDNNGQNEFIPTQNFNNPAPVEGFDNTSSTFIEKGQQPWFLNGDKSEEFIHDSGKGFVNKNNYIGLEWKQDLGNGFFLSNNARLSNLSTEVNSVAVTSPMKLDFFLSHIILGTLGPQGLGTFVLRDRSTGEVLARVNQSFDPTVPAGPPFAFNVIENNLPGQNVSPNSVFYTPFASGSDRINEFTDQLTLTKSLKNMDFSIGGYMSLSSLDYTEFFAAAEGISTLENRPRLIDVSLEGIDGNTYQFTSPNGAMRIGGVGRKTSTLRQSNYAFFFGHNWQITDKLNLDWGGRYEYVGTSGTNNGVIPNDPLMTNGGYDGDILTMYDNFDGTPTPGLDYEGSLGTFSYSAGLNYRASKSLAFYARFSNGQKAPNATYFLEKFTQEEFDNIPLVAQDIIQLEGGVKYQTENLRFNITPFYSILDNVNEFTVGQNVDNTTYFLTDILNKYTTIGVEIEGSVSVAKNFKVDLSATFQDAEATEFATYDLGGPGPQDDQKLENFSGNKLGLNPNVMASITPAYDNGTFMAGLNFYHMGARQSNAANTFEIPAFTTLNLRLGYRVSDKFRIGLNITNLTNTYGVMSWTAPGFFPLNLDQAGFTPERLAANPDAIFGSLAIPARAYFLSATYDF